MKRFLIAVSCYLVVAFALSAGAQDPFSLKVDVAVVTVDVSVADSNGNLIRDLTKDDFLVYEDGVLRPILFFNAASAPCNVFLLFDSSASTVGHRDFMIKAVDALVENLRPQDKIAMAGFDDDFRLALRWTSDRTKAASAIRDIMRPHESYETHFYAALDRTLRREFKDAPGRGAIVVLTDGEDTPLLTGSDKDYRNTLTALTKERKQIYIVGLETKLPAPVIFQNTLNALNLTRSNMERITNASGGQLLDAKTVEEVVELYEKVGRTLGTAYSVGFAPMSGGADGSFHNIEVKTRDSSLRLTQSRSIYYAEPQKTSRD